MWLFANGRHRRGPVLHSSTFYLLIMKIQISLEMEFHMMNTIYAALTMRAQTEKTTFSCKDDKCEFLHICIGVGAKDL